MQFVPAQLSVQGDVHAPWYHGILLLSSLPYFSCSTSGCFPAASSSYYHDRISSHHASHAGKSRGTMALPGSRCRLLLSAFALTSIDTTTVEAQDAIGVDAKLKMAHRPAPKDSHALLRHQGIEPPKLQTRSSDEGAAAVIAAPVSYVFLQKFPLEGTDDLLWHTEVLVCPREGFAPDEQEYLDQMIESLTDFARQDGKLHRIRIWRR